MKKAKRAFSIFMCAVLLLALLPTAALAEGEQPGENQYKVEYDNSNGKTVEVDGVTLGRSDVKSFEATKPITFTFSEPPYEKVIVRENGAEDKELTVSGTSFSYTPETSEGFELRVYWSEAEYNFDTIPCNWGTHFIAEYQVRFDRCEPAGGCTVSYNVTPDTSISYDGRTRLVLANGTTQVKLTITAAEGYVYEVRVPGQDDPESVEDNVYTWAVGEDSDVRPEIVFRSENSNPDEENPDEENPGGGTTPEPTNYEGARDYIEGWDLAYYGIDADAVKTLMATELWNEGFCDYNGHTGGYTGMFADLNAFKGAIALSAYTTTADSKIPGLPYYTYTVMLHDVDGTENDIKAEGRVYKLSGAKDFGVKIGTNEYHILNTSTLHGEDNDIYVRSTNDISNIKVFGNGVCSSNLSLGSGDGWAAHISQDHSGLDAAYQVAEDAGYDTERGGEYYKYYYPVGGIVCRLVVLPADYTGVKIVSEKTAAAWGFAEVPIFATGTGSDSPVAEIFYGNNGTEGRKVTISRINDSVNSENLGTSIYAIAVDTTQISVSVANIDDNEDGTFTVAFNSNYDVVPLIVTYNDGSTGKLTIHRVGLHLENNHVNGSSYQISHGTDRFVQYSTENAREVVTAAFYYMGEDKPTESISLFVTVETTNGTTRKVVTRLNSDFIQTTGNDKWADDFLLWSGTDEEYANLISVSAIAYSAGTEGNFGGVKVGSGTGVEWAKSEPNPAQ